MKKVDKVIHMPLLPTHGLDATRPIIVLGASIQNSYYGKVFIYFIQ